MFIYLAFGECTKNKKNMFKEWKNHKIIDEQKEEQKKNKMQH